MKRKKSLNKSKKSKILKRLRIQRPLKTNQKLLLKIIPIRIKKSSLMKLKKKKSLQHIRYTTHLQFIPLIFA